MEAKFESRGWEVGKVRQFHFGSSAEVLVAARQLARSDDVPSAQCLSLMLEVRGMLGVLLAPLACGFADFLAEIPNAGLVTGCDGVPYPRCVVCE